MKKVFVVFSVVVSFAFLSCKGQSNSEVKNISTDEMQSLLKADNIQLVDVRTPKEYKGGFIANAKNIDYYSPEFDKEIKKLDKDKAVILYCHSGGRSANGAKKMLKMGFVKVYNLEGGIVEWRKKGLEIKKE